MVATRYWESYRRMAPGTNSMLRARRKDKDVRPNRLLDRTASRGMLYENEELRLRTININAELDKGQQYIKKLRRENSQLRREIWSIRDQYDKLESMIRNQEQDQVIENPETYEKEISDETNQLETLSIVAEESENEESRNIEEGLENSTANYQPNNGFNESTAINDLSKQVYDLATIVPVSDDDLKISGEDEPCPSSEANVMAPLKSCEDFVNEFYKIAEEQKTLVFGVESFENLNVQEVIDNLEPVLCDDCSNVVSGVWLTCRHCYITVKDTEGCNKLLEAGLKIRDIEVVLEHVWDHSTILQLSAVPHQVLDERIVATVSRFADVIGNIHRQTYKGLDTGERFVHIKTPDLIPNQLLCGSLCIPITVIYPKSERANIARRKSFRSQINISLKTPERDFNENSAKLSNTSQEPSQDSAASKVPSFFSKTTGITLTPTDIEANVFKFPNSITETPNQTVQKKKSIPAVSKEQKPSSSSPSVFRKFAQRSFRRPNEISQPPSPAVFPITPKFVRRSSVNFRSGPTEGMMRSRGSDGYYEYDSPFMRERSASDVSSGRQSICRRKLSITGHEGTTKIPWCGCWGIGCC